jgi:hypothetical protein
MLCRVSTADMNTVLSQTLVQLLFPPVKLPTSKPLLRESPSRHVLPDVPDPIRDRSMIDDVIRSTVVAPHLKFIDVRSDYVYIDTMIRPTGRRPGTAGQVRSSVADLLKRDACEDDVEVAKERDQSGAPVAGVKKRAESVARGKRVDAGSLSSYSRAAKGTATGTASSKPASADPSTTASRKEAVDIGKKSVGPPTTTSRSRAKLPTAERTPSLKVEEWSALATRLALAVPRRRSNGKRIKHVAAKVFSRCLLWFRSP